MQIIFKQATICIIQYNQQNKIIKAGYYPEIKKLHIHFYCFINF